MHWQIEAQIRDVGYDETVKATEQIADILRNLVDRDDDRFYIALVPRPAKTKAAE